MRVAVLVVAAVAALINRLTVLCEAHRYIARTPFHDG
jgi:hypothetical protein